MARTYSKGFSIVEVGLIVAVIAIIGGLGFVFYNKWQATQTAKTATPVASTPSKAPAAITKTSDLDTAATALDSTDVVSSSDSAALNSNLAF